MIFLLDVVDGALLEELPPPLPTWLSTQADKINRETRNRNISFI
jgi:hypothetical protein